MKTFFQKYYCKIDNEFMKVMYSFNSKKFKLKLKVITKVINPHSNRHRQNHHQCVAQFCWMQMSLDDHL